MSKVSSVSCFNKSSAFLLVLCLVSSIAEAAILFESANLGDLGQLGGPSIYSEQMLGASFFVDEPVYVTAVGGHVIGSAGTFFAAIIELESLGALPPDPPFDSSDVVVSTVFETPYPSDDVRIPLTTVLDQGHYAILLGTDQLGASGGSGAMPVDGQQTFDHNGALIWNVQPGADEGEWIRGYSLGCRFVVEGVPVPEPAGFLFLLLGSLYARKRLFE